MPVRPTSINILPSAPHKTRLVSTTIGKAPCFACLKKTIADSKRDKPCFTKCASDRPGNGEKNKPAAYNNALWCFSSTLPYSPTKCAYNRIGRVRTEKRTGCTVAGSQPDNFSSEVHVDCRRKRQTSTCCDLNNAPHRNRQGRSGENHLRFHVSTGSRRARIHRAFYDSDAFVRYLSFGTEINAPGAAIQYLDPKKKWKRSY